MAQPRTGLEHAASGRTPNLKPGPEHMKNTRLASIARSVICLLFCAIALNTSARADYVTELKLTAPAGPDNVDRIVFTWDTTATSGVVGSALTDYAVELFSGSTSVFSDTVMVGGSLLPIQGSLPRDPITFDFDLDTMWLNQFNQGVYTSGFSTTGIYYETTDNVALSVDGFVLLYRWDNGSLERYDTSLESQHTSRTVPEGGATLALLGLALGVLAAVRRQLSIA